MENQSRRERMKAKAEFIKKWADLISDLADGELEVDEDDMDLGVGLDMAIHLAVLLDGNKMDHAQQLLSLLDEAARTELEASADHRAELISDAKELFPRRFV